MVSGLADYRAPETDSRSDSLSGRQRQILELLTQGKANKEIAYELGIGIGTVKQHLVALYKKMGVTNRAMAVSKGFSSLHPAPTAVGEDEQYLERRSAVVLSLQVISKSGEISVTDVAKARRVLSQNALDFDALFLSSPGARGDIILGLERTRRHDCLRAVRLAISVSREVNKRLGPDYRLRAGMSCGFVLKGIDDDTAWTGEVIATEVISEARQSMSQSPIGAMSLSEGALQTVLNSGVGIEPEGSHEIPLNSKFRWSYNNGPLSTQVIGRDTELSDLLAGFHSLGADQPQTVCIESSAGMGRTTVVRGYDALCAGHGIPVHVYKALLPNTRPSGASRGLIEPMGSSKAPVAANRLLDIIAQLNQCVVIVEDCHALPADDFELLARPSPALAKARVQLVLTFRGRIGDEVSEIDGVSVMRLARLEEPDARALVRELAPKNRRLQQWVLDKSNGVPGFIAALSAAALGHEDATDFDQLPVPFDLFSMIEERVDALGVDRNILFKLAESDAAGQLGLDVDGLARAQKAGFLKKNRQTSGTKKTYVHANPTVAWVMANSFVRRSTVFAG